MSEPKNTTIALPHPCRLGLLDLYGKAAQAKREYELALNAAVSAIGLDPQKPHSVNLDTGLIEVAP